MIRRTAATALLLSAAGALTAGVVAATPAGASSVRACTGGLVRVTVGQQQGAAGHGYVTLHFRNISQSTCSLTGYPGLDAVGRHGRTLAHAQRTRGVTHGVHTVVLQSWQMASAYSEWLNFNPSTGGACRFSSSIAVTPPNTSSTRHKAVSVSVCSLQIHPVVKGRTGMQQ
jgi:Protein of unknown function (DUF4232)